ncbi:hypothetical protein [Brachybacterium hainanense]|uniref:Uncharacterized protein n=1 Tax=Brachybacterium hainanense TaxID=1541174 RepID=A0ABV6R877_9MICO
MNWLDEYSEHPLWQAVDDARGPSGRPPDTLGGDYPDLTKALIESLKEYQDYPHPAITPRLLDDTLSAVNAVLTPGPIHRRTTPSGNKAPADTSDPVEQLASTVRQWAIAKRRDAHRSPREAFRLEKIASRSLERVDKFVSQQESRLDSRDLKSLEILEDARARANQITLESQALAEREISKAAARLAKIEDLANTAAVTIEQQKTRLDEALNSHQESFNRSQELRNNSWTATLERSESEIREHIARMGENEKRSLMVLSAIGVNSTATDYGNHANQQAKIANSWRFGALLAYCLAACLFVVPTVALYLKPESGIDWWQLVIQRIGAPGGVAAVGYFLSRESGQHRAQERLSRQIQLTLTAIEPFIATLPGKQKEQIRVETARKIFALSDKIIFKGASKRSPSLHPHSQAAENVT